MRFVRMLVTVTLAAGLAGFATPSLAGAAPPEADTSVKATWKKLQKALKKGDCEQLAKNFLLHTSLRSSRGTPPEPATPDTPISDEECTNTEEFASSLEGVKLKKFKEFGSGAIGEGTSPDIEPGTKFVLVFLLDQDGKWKAFYGGQFDPQIGTEPAEDLDWDAAANGFVESLRANDCEQVWFHFTADSAYVTTRAQTGGATKLCEDLQTSVATGVGRTYDLVNSTGELDPLGGTADMAFYGFEAESSRYITVVLFTAVPGTPGVDEHSDPGVYEYVTSRAPEE